MLPCAVSRVIPGLRQLLPRYPCIQQSDGSLADIREDMLPAPPQPPPPQLPVDALAAGEYQLYVLLNNSIPTLTHLVDSAGEHPARARVSPWQCGFDLLVHCQRGTLVSWPALSVILFSKMWQCQPARLQTPRVAATVS